MSTLKFACCITVAAIGLSENQSSYPSIYNRLFTHRILGRNKLIDPYKISVHSKRLMDENHYYVCYCYYYDDQKTKNGACVI